MYKTVCAASLVVVAMVCLSWGGVPQTINYQGYLKNTNGAPVTTATSIRFSLYSSNPARNNPVWRETQNVTPANGIYSVQLGSQTPITAPFDVPYHLGIKVGVDAEMALQPLASVPYALRSVTAENAASALTIASQGLTELDSRYAILSNRKQLLSRSPRCAGTRCAAVI